MRSLQCKCYTFKDGVYKRKISEAEISTMLANYTFKDGVAKKLGDPGIPTILRSIKRNYVKTALCDLGVGVSVMPFSL